VLPFPVDLQASPGRTGGHETDVLSLRDESRGLWTDALRGLWT